MGLRRSERNDKVRFMTAIIVYGKPDCVDFLRSKTLLDRFAIPFEFHDIQSSAAAAVIAEEISGGSSSPVLVFPDGSFQVEPSYEQLAVKLGVDVEAGGDADSRKLR